MNGARESARRFQTVSARLLRNSHGNAMARKSDKSRADFRAGGIRIPH
jgi:hypothetical protein